MMGVQNIKGTGYDFALQWMAWRDVHRLLAPLRAEPPRLDEGLSQVERAQLDNRLSCEVVLDALDVIDGNKGHAARVKALQDRVRARVEALASPGGASRAGGSRLTRGLLAVLEGLMDPFDAVLRRWRADRIYRDLVAKRISHPAAQRELYRLVKRQKGGWLSPRGEGISAAASG